MWLYILNLLLYLLFFEIEIYLQILLLSIKGVDCMQHYSI